MSPVASELIFANEPIFVKELRIRAILAGCASGLFLCLVTIKFPSCFNFGKSEKWECARRGGRALWFEGSKGAAGAVGEEVVCGWM